MSPWPRVTVLECAANEKYSTQIGPFGNKIRAETYTSYGIPVLRGVNVKFGRFHDDDFVFISEQAAEDLKPFACQPDDVILVHKGTIGRAGIIPSNCKYKRYIMGNSMMRVRCDQRKILPLFMYYWLSSEEGKNYLLNRVSQVGVPQIQSPLTTLREASFRCPPIRDQEYIVNILGTLDDKIELNHKMNENLQAMAQAIFKSWFVDFDPVRAKREGKQPSGMDAETAALFPSEFEMVDGREVPKGWKVAILGDHSEATRGLSYKGNGLCNDGIPLHNLNSVLEGGGYKYPGIKFYSGEYQERHIVKPGDVIVTNTEQGFGFLLIGYPAIIPKYYNEIGLFSHHLYRVRPLKESPLTNHFIYHLLMVPGVRDQVIGCTNGTTVNMMHIDGLKTPNFILPPVELIHLFEKIISPIFDIMENNVQESHMMAKTRDTLLPKLMSGEIVLGDASP